MISDNGINSIKNITILGSTGSIGVQALDVLSSGNFNYKINFLTANNNIALLEKQTQKYNPNAVVIANENSYYEFVRNTSFKGKIYCGDEAVQAAASDDKNDLVISSLVGFSGVLPTIEALKKGKKIALANKETLVSAGKIITNLAKEYNSEIIAIDSEHSAILQCLVGEQISQVEKLILTASGGPFRNTPFEEFQNITVEQALNHPNWSMGSKITIDSATMMNKGFEVIEAFWLFDVDYQQIEVIIHPQSIIHSMVQFIDGSMKAQLGLPDMRIPIAYSLSYPERFSYDFPRMNLSEIGKLDFYEPDMQRYPCLQLSFDSIKSGGNATAVLNAANEICVSAFLNRKIRFVEISQFINNALESIPHIDNPTITEIIDSDKETREFTNSLISRI